MVIIYRSSDIAEAHILKGMLNANGIEAFLGGHYLQGGIGELLATDYATLAVKEEDADAAKKLLAAYDESLPDRTGQDRAESTGPATDKPVSFSPVLALAMVTGIIVLLIYYIITTEY